MYRWWHRLGLSLVLGGCADHMTSADGEASGGGETEDAPGTSCPPTSQPDAAFVSEVEMASSMAAILCMAHVGCDCPARTHDTVDSCRHALNMDFESVRSAAQDRGLVYDGACLGQLESAVAALGCDLEADALVDAELLGAGRCAVYHGDRQLGQSCEALASYASDCAQRLACWGGQCVVPCEAASLGARAIPYGFACAPGESAVGYGGRCEVLPSSATGCGAGGCGPGTYCANPLGEEVPMCAPQREVGETCDPTEGDAPCRDGLCEQGTCIAAPTAGEPCVADRCGDDLRCDAGTCGPLPEICQLRPRF